MFVCFFASKQTVSGTVRLTQPVKTRQGNLLLFPACASWSVCKTS